MARKCERRGTFLRLSIRDCFIAVIVLFFLLRIDLIDYIDRIDSDKNQIYRNVFRSQICTFAVTLKSNVVNKERGSFACRGIKEKKELLSTTRKTTLLFTILDET